MEEDFSPLLIFVLVVSFFVDGVLALLETHALIADVGRLLLEIGQADVAHLVLALWCGGLVLFNGGLALLAHLLQQCTQLQIFLLTIHFLFLLFFLFAPQPDQTNLELNCRLNPIIAHSEVNDFSLFNQPFELGQDRLFGLILFFL